MSVVLEKKNSNDAKVHSKDHAMGLKWLQKESIAQAVLCLEASRQYYRIFDRAGSA